MSFDKISISLELQYGSGVSVRMDPTDEVEVPDVQGTIGAAGQSHWSEQHHVPCSTAAARTTGDAAVKTVAHHGADYRRLLGEEDVLPIAFVKDSWKKKQAHVKGCITAVSVAAQRSPLAALLHTNLWSY